MEIVYVLGDDRLQQTSLLKLGQRKVSGVGLGFRKEASGRPYPLVEDFGFGAERVDRGYHQRIIFGPEA